MSLVGVACPITARTASLSPPFSASVWTGKQDSFDIGNLGSFAVALLRSILGVCPALPLAIAGWAFGPQKVVAANDLVLQR